MKEKKRIKKFKPAIGHNAGCGKEEHGFFCNSNIRALGTDSEVSASS